jgi:hypothetical protein
VARYDKYDPMVGGFRAPLAATWLDADVNRPRGVGLDANGAVVKGAGVTGIIGVIVLTKARKAGEIVDIMTSGEIVEWDPVTAGTAGTSGTKYYSATDGTINSTSATGKVVLGYTVESTRMVVRVELGALA